MLIWACASAFRACRCAAVCHMLEAWRSRPFCAAGYTGLDRDQCHCFKVKGLHSGYSVQYDHFCEKLFEEAHGFRYGRFAVSMLSENVYPWMFHVMSICSVSQAHLRHGFQSSDYRSTFICVL
jgi:hypothetical protein